MKTDEHLSTTQDGWCRAAALVLALGLGIHLAVTLQADGDAPRNPEELTEIQADRPTPAVDPLPGRKIALDGILATGTKLYSENDEELIIRDFFQDRRGGVFLDVGAGHWKKSSTTLYLEKHLDWSGVAIDAQARYRKGFQRHRPRTRFEAFAVSDQTGGTIPLYLAGPVTSIDPNFRKKFKAFRDKRAKVVDVPQITLNDLLERLGVERIDFLSMDIEGAEPKALAGFDIERFAPELVCIEMPRGREQVLMPYFERHGYERLEAYGPYDRVNRYFARRPTGR